MSRRLPDVERGEALSVILDGRPVTAYAGETIATVLLAEAAGPCYRSATGEARSLICGMGVCYECLVAVDTGDPGRAADWVRACTTPVTAGMRIRTGRQLARRVPGAGESA